MAKATKKEAGSTTKSTKATKPAAKTKAATTKASKTTKATNNRPSEAQQKSNKRSSEPRKATERSPEPKQPVKLSSEPKQPAKRPAVKAIEADAAPLARRTPSRADQVIVEPAAHIPGVEKSSPDDIAERAYFLFLERGGHHGCDVDDWLEAERQVTGTHA